jgi:heptose I phosphotransferase
MSMKQIWLSDRFLTLWKGRDPFAEVDRLQGEVFRQVASRRTIRVALDGRHYFAKIHHGVGWREIFKNLLHLKLPVLGAQNEWRALNRLHEIGVRTLTPVAFGHRGRNPARVRSFLITEELTGTTSLEDFCATWAAHPPAPRLRSALIEQLAGLVRGMHSHGINHRDCYICHFHLDTSCGLEPFEADPTRGPDAQRPSGPGAGKLRLYVIDLHRAQIRRRTPRRWLIKDLAGLYFSALDIGMTRTDRCRFVAAYEQKPLRQVFQTRKRFWKRVERTALALHTKRRRCRLSQ